MRRLLLPLGAVLALGALAPAAPAAVTVGIGDQNAAMFDQQAFKDLKLKRARYFIRWDAIRDPATLAAADAYVAKAKASRVSVFMHISTNDFTEKAAELPSVSRYRSSVGALVKRYRAQGVKEWGVWNEANHKTQPTWDDPARAASFFKVFDGWKRSSTCRGCTVVALDVLDQPGVERYIQRFNRALSSTYRRRATIVGIHNYAEVNRRYTTKTRNIVNAQRRYNRRTKYWYTETGGLVELGTSFRCSESRARSRTKYMFDLARRHRANVTRLYAYQWTGTDCSTRFDAGLTRADGSVRPAYGEFRRGLSRTGFKR
jgi:hypothetical protein